MADSGSYGLSPRLDLEQLFIEARHRWLRPTEICEILCHYQEFNISSEPRNQPPSGSLFLFDRKVLRYFRKDGHNWRKKKDGKTVKEAHEKLKVGSVDVLHCYYAHGEENENFQRRSYWMLEEELMHIVFVHYLEVKGNRTSNSPVNSFSTNHNKEPSEHTDSTNPTSTLLSVCEDTDSVDSHQGNARYNFYRLPQVQNGAVIDNVNVDDGMWRQPQINKSQPITSGIGTISYHHADRGGNNNYITGSQSLGKEFLEQISTVYNGSPSHVLTSSTQAASAAFGGSMTIKEILATGIDPNEKLDGSLPILSNWQIPCERSSLHLSDDSMDLPLGLDLDLDLDLGYDWDFQTFEKRTHDANPQDALHSDSYGPDQQNKMIGQDNVHMQIASKETQQPMQSNFHNDFSVEGNEKYALVMKSLLSGEEGFKKVDSFSRWVSRELGEVDDLNVRPSSTIAWSSVECGNVMDDSSLSPSLSQDQLFSIIDFSPKWSYTDSEVEVYIIGTFLKGQEEVENCYWSCMFGEVEVPAEVITDGVLCCRSPCHDVARVPFYITNSNRLACSEVREFDYRLCSSQNVDVIDIFGGTTELHLYSQLERLLAVRSSSSLAGKVTEKRKLISKLISLKEEAEQSSTSIDDFSGDELKQQFLQNQMKEKLYSWLLHKVTEGGKGPSILDDDGQGVLHLVAALGFDWAIKPMMAAGVSINFRDANGWTALHWAAFNGREKTVAVLVSLGAATGLLADPSPENPLGRTPADLASANGHKGISGFLAESSLTNYLSGLTVNDSKGDQFPDGLGAKAVQTITERTATPVDCGYVQEELSLKDSLTAVCNATQAASRIYQVFRMQSFQWKKQAAENNDDNLVTSDECALSIIASKKSKFGHSNGIINAAAVQIQKKYRGWKKRKEFLILKQRIVKLQAHVRGHQARKKYKTITWSVGILEKVILRWRRKGSGLRGFRRDGLANESNSEMPPKEDDYDFLKEGRKQNEERMQHALNRVRSMIHYPEGRAQYRRLLTVVEGFREAQGSDMVLSNSEAIGDGDENLPGIDLLLDDDSFMSMAFD